MDRTEVVSHPVFVTDVTRDNGSGVSLLLVPCFVLCVSKSLSARRLESGKRMERIPLDEVSQQVIVLGLYAGKLASKVLG